MTTGFPLSNPSYYEQTPSIYSQQLAGQQDLKNSSQMGSVGFAIVLPQDKMDDISFTKLDYRSKYGGGRDGGYRTEASRPQLLPMGALRMAAPEFKTSQEGWKTHYDELLSNLPEELQAGVMHPETEDQMTLNALLELGAKVLDWQTQAGKSVQSESAQTTALLNQILPTVALNQSLSLGNELLAIAEKWLDDTGPNDPSYLEGKDLIHSLDALFEEVSPPLTGQPPSRGKLTL